MKALITGFDPFNGERINPAFQAIKGIPDIISNCQIIKLEIPTIFNKSIAILNDTINEQNPDIVICVGQAGGRFDISPEYVAINLDEARIPDNEGNKPSGKSIIDSGENAYFTTLPIKAITKELKMNNIPSKISYTAGTFVCNHLFYGLMHIINKNHLNIKGGFIHVPYLPEQVVKKNNQPYMSLDMITEGLILALKTTIEYEEDIEFQSGTEC